MYEVKIGKSKHPIVPTLSLGMSVFTWILGLGLDLVTQCPPTLATYLIIPNFVHTQHEFQT